MNYELWTMDCFAQEVKQPVFAGAPFYGDGTSELLFEQGLCLPSGAGLTDAELEYVCETVRAVGGVGRVGSGGVRE